MLKVVSLFCETENLFASCILRRFGRLSYQAVILLSLADLHFWVADLLPVKLFFLVLLTLLQLQPKSPQGEHKQ